MSRSVVYDELGRLTTDTDALSRATSMQYLYNTDLVSKVTYPDGRQVDTYYDQMYNPYLVTKPYSGSPPSVPFTFTTYDGGMNSLAAAWWNNENFVGAPKLHTIGIGAGTAINANWGAGSPYPELGDKFSLRLTGDFHVATTGTYAFGADADDTIKVIIDDTIRYSADSAMLNGGAAFTLNAGWHRIRVDFRETGGLAKLNLLWSINGASFVTIPGSELHPRLGLTTSVIDPDGIRVDAGYGGPAPQYRLATSIIQDPLGLALTETTTYETLGATGSFLRRASTTSASGGTRTYAYYATGATRANPCSGGTAVNQGGLLYRTTEPDPDGAGPQLPIKREIRYDVMGRIIAQATFTTADPVATDWVCTTFDARGREVQTYFPAYGGASARTVTTNWLWNGFPTAKLVTDSGGSVGTLTDALGRITNHWDVFGVMSTIVYDQAGRVTSSSNVKSGTVARSYDNAGQVTSMTYGGATIANAFVYDTVGRLTSISYPSGTGKAGNGTTGQFTYDAHGDEASVTWRTPSNTVITSDSVVRTNGGRLWDRTVDGVTPSTSLHEYTYDGAGRLYAASVNGRSQAYGYGTSACGNVNAGKNTNRTSLSTSDGGGPVVTRTYCYDTADRLISSSDPAVGTVAYDSHGNTTSIFGETHAYDFADRHRSTTKGSTTVTYARDATDRITSRSVNGAIAAKYSFSGLGDSPAATLDSANQLLEATIVLPGGVLVTTRSSGYVWSYPNLTGDLVAVANQAGVKQGSTVTYDPFGNRVGAAPAIDNSAGLFDYGWLGEHQRPVEAESTLQPVIEMGARQYSPLLGRFLEVDPVEGGSSNDYDYVDGDPANAIDLAGTNKCEVGANPLRWTGNAHACAKKWTASASEWLRCSANTRDKVCVKHRRDLSRYREQMRPICSASRTPVFGSALPSEISWRQAGATLFETVYNLALKAAGTLVRQMKAWATATGYVGNAATAVDLYCRSLRL